MSSSPNGSWRPRLVALDIDGTVVDRDGVLPVRRRVVRLVVDAGVPVVLPPAGPGTAPGRSSKTWGCDRILNRLNGAVIVSYPPESIVKAITFDPREVIARVVDFAPGTLIAVEEIGRGYRLNDHFPGGDLTGEMIIEDIEQLSARPVTRVILRDPNRSDEDFVSLAQHLGLKGVTYFVGWSAWLDIAPRGVSKATALRDIADELGVAAADVLAFGDGRNDIDMLSWAGRGVAIGDAPEEGQRAADAVSDRLADGGPTAELMRWFG
jgi:hydroxymethylpyrimidine pyrophosphatase-like HAD family hydrolase